MFFRKPKFWDNPRLTLWAVILYPLSLIIKASASIQKLISKENKFDIPIVPQAARNEIIAHPHILL